MANEQGPGCTAEEALARLKEGNARFVSGRGRFPSLQKDILADLAQGQQPYATILGCSDSRVPPEVVFDAHLGELFVVRVAGNVLGNAIFGTLQYAGAHLRTPLFVVMGHEGCGAVQAAIASKFHGAEHKSRIELLVDNILPALDGLDGSQPPDALLHFRRRGERAPHRPDAARDAGGEGASRDERHEARRRHLRARNRAA